MQGQVLCVVKAEPVVIMPQSLLCLRAPCEQRCSLLLHKQYQYAVIARVKTSLVNVHITVYTH